MTTKTKNNRTDRRKAQIVAKARAQSDRAARRQAIKKQREDAQEAADEAIAPAVQRLATDYRLPRLVRDGVSFRVACPIEFMVQQGRRRELRGGEPTINERHLAAVRRLTTAWEISQTITAGVSGYDQKISGTPDSGWLSQAQLRRVARQQQAAAEIASVRTALGPALWPIVEAIALNGQTAQAWALEKKLQEQVVLGFLRASLDVLVAHLAARDAQKRR